MTETKEALRTEISGVCRTYCSQVWNEAINQAGVKASSVLRKPENVYYPQAIHASSSSSSKADTPPEVVDPEKSSPKKVLPSFGSPPKVAEQPRVNKKETEVTKGVASNATKPLATP